uniref:LIM zinc-binding domain-containing protein n=1 Tax=Xiphophorus couchianus TaxID=32473 RepID=A0A3B5M8D0_9TELE
MSFCVLWRNFGEKKRSLGRDYHPLCLKCQRCNRQLTAGQHAEYDDKPYCTHCYMKMFGPRCTLSGHTKNTHAHSRTFVYAFKCLRGL